MLPDESSSASWKIFCSSVVFVKMKKNVTSDLMETRFAKFLFIDLIDFIQLT